MLPVIVYDAPGRDVSPRIDGEYVVWASQFACLNQLCRGAFGYPTARNFRIGEIWELTTEMRAGGVLLAGRLASWTATTGQRLAYDLESRKLIPVPPMFIEGTASGRLIVRLNGPGDEQLSLYDPRTIAAGPENSGFGVW